ncbi:MAG: signal peptidase I [Lachnospiraceae bacterium]|nr:signal peptidase I [Lachnospiraceae bacterium]
MTDPFSTGSVGYYLVVLIIGIAIYWRILAKAGEPGWGILIPFYNLYLWFKISFGNGWLFLLLFVPLVNVVIGIMLPFKLAAAFGEGVGFGFGLLCISIIFYPLLAFGNYTYYGPQ